VVPRIIASLSVALVVAALGCSGVPDVVVVTSEGTPIAGANVEPVSASMNGPSVLTDASGEARLPSGPQPAEWVNVRKDGYLARTNVPLEGPRPIRVVLVPR